MERIGLEDVSNTLYGSDLECCGSGYKLIEGHHANGYTCPDMFGHTEGQSAGEDTTAGSEVERYARLSDADVTGEGHLRREEGVG